MNKMQAEISALAARCSADEQEAVLYILRRLDAARTKYGSLDLDSDPREWMREARDEFGDAVWYVTFWMLMQARRR